MNLGQFFLILRARWMVAAATLLFVVAAAAIVSLVLPKKYSATATVVVDFKAPDPISGALLPVLPGYMATQQDIIKSHRVAVQVVKNLKLADSPGARAQFTDATDGRGSIEDFFADLVGRGLDVEPSKESSVIDITYTGPDSRFASLLANSFAQAYIETNLALKVEPARQNAAWFDAQSKTLRENLEHAQARLSAYQRKEGLVATDERIDVDSARLAELSTQLTTLQAQLSDSENRLRQAKDYLASGGQLDTLPEILSNAFIQQLKTDILRGEANLKQLYQQLGTNHPAYQRALAESESLRGRLTEELRKVTSGLENTHRINVQRMADVRNALAAQKARLLSVRGDRDELNVLVREVESAQRAYELATGRYQQSSLESQTTQTNVILLSAAIEPLEPSSPKLLRNLLIATFLGTILGLGLAFLVEFLDHRVRSAANLAETLGVPLLGAIDRVGGLKKRGRRGLRFWRREPRPLPAAM